MNYLRILLPLIVGLLSFFIVAQYASSPEFHKKRLNLWMGKNNGHGADDCCNGYFIVDLSIAG